MIHQKLFHIRLYFVKKKMLKKEINRLTNRFETLSSI